MFDTKKKFNFVKYFEIPKTVYLYSPDFYIEAENLPEEIRNKYVKHAKEKMCPHCGSKIKKIEEEIPVNILAEIDTTGLVVAYNFFDCETEINMDYRLSEVVFRDANDNYFFCDEASFYCEKFKKDTSYLFPSYEEAISVLSKNKVKNILVFDKNEEFKEEIIFDKHNKT